MPFRDKYSGPFETDAHLSNDSRGLKSATTSSGLRFRLDGQRKLCLEPA